MKRLIRKHKLLLVLLVILVITGSIVYYLFVPEFKQSETHGFAYIYVDDGGLFKKDYLVKYGEEFHLDIKNNKFKIYIPVSYYMEGKWTVENFTNDTFKFEKSYKKACRLPIYDWKKQGSGYDMAIFEFSTIKEPKGKLVFNYNYNNDIRNITVLIN